MDEDEDEDDDMDVDDEVKESENQEIVLELDPLNVDAGHVINVGGNGRITETFSSKWENKSAPEWIDALLQKLKIQIEYKHIQILNISLQS